MIHDYDALNWDFRRAASRHRARHAQLPSGGFDQVQVLIDYADGASALVDGGMMMPESYPFPHDSKCSARRARSTPSAPVVVASRWVGTTS